MLGGETSKPGGEPDSKPAGAWTADLLARLLRLRPRLRRVEELLRASGFFDETFYRASYELPAWGEAAPILHYLLRGGRQAMDPHPLFFGGRYTARQVDAQGFRAPLLHFLLYGRHYGGGVTLPDVEPAVLAGLIGNARDGLASLFRRPVEEIAQIEALRPAFLRRWAAGLAVPAQVGAFDKTLGEIALDSEQLDRRSQASGAAVIGQMAAALPTPASVIERWMPEVRGALAQNWPQAASPIGANPREEGGARATLLQLLANDLESFLAGDERIVLPPAGQPRVTILLVLFNQAAATLGCLKALLAQANPPSYEVVIVDNASSDRTAALLERIDGARILRHDQNLHFIAGVNSALDLIRGEQLLLLNNDAFLAPDALRNASDLLAADDTVGAVGGRLIFSDGSLQEAGSYLLPDASSRGYGRGWPSGAPQAMFRRDVDYVSGALLMMRSDFFKSRGGFDRRFKSAYYEDVDLCEAIWADGKRVVFEPSVAAIHLESTSSPNVGAAVDLMHTNRAVLAAKYAPRFPGPAGKGDPRVLRFRADRMGQRLLFIDDRIPLARYGSGFPRARAMLEVLLELGQSVTFVPTAYHGERWEEVWAELPREIEVLPHLDGQAVWPLLGQAMRDGDTVLISRPQNLERHAPMLRLARHQGWHSRVIYDAEAIFARREILQARVEGHPLPGPEAERRAWDEGRLAACADALLAVSAAEAEELRRLSGRPAFVLPHTIEAAPGATGFDARNGALFVGATHVVASPNGDALRWMAERIWPRMAPWLPHRGLRVAGHMPPRLRNELQQQGLDCLGVVQDLAPIYDRARIFVAPTRFAAGVPLKILEAAAAGLPVVASHLLGQQLGWRDGHEIVLAEPADPQGFANACRRLYQDAALWQRIRDNALARVARDCDRTRFREALEKALQRP